ncbi:histone deacetylase 6-like isoform X1 [Mya arenaria]|uniref:histone deacetylase 6-like isoform X1 n=2 Tax=Mya arenaria TaxID=6604 RepID=UPI0022DF7143|nr:histone deacetylase 6-like isoform X1 [Mya arenaria]
MSEKEKERISLEEAMARGREAQKRLEELDKEERARLEADGWAQDEDKTEEGDSDEEEYNSLIAGLSEVALLMKKPNIVNGTGFLYDERCLAHKNEWDPGHPEKPARASCSYERCSQLGLVERCTRIEARYGREDEVLLQHDFPQIEALQATSAMTVDEHKDLARRNEDVYFNQSTYECALLGVGSTIEVMESVLKKQVRNGFALVRPPGHHASTDAFCGFCFYNNVAIAAKHALDNLGLNRILVVDWDVHHGQATQRQFYNDNRLLYISIHRYEYGKYWPNLRESDYDYIGNGDGRGFNVNIPLNQTKLGDSDYLSIFQQIIMPLAYQFNPELVLVSSGFDAAVGCPEGEMLVTPAAYAHFVHMMSQLAEGRVCVVLEGGYNLKSLSEGVALSLRELLGDPCPLLKSTQEPSDSVVESILNAIKVLSPYWSCLAYQTSLMEGDLCTFPGVNTTPPLDGVEFITDKSNAVYDLDYSYPYSTVQEYFENEKKWDDTIDHLIAEMSLAVPPHRTCLVYDAGMKAHRPLDYPNHPEKPERISRIYDKHRELGLLDRCLLLKCRLAEGHELELCHTSSHVEFMSDLENRDLDVIKHYQYKHNSVYLCRETNICAKMAVGGTLNVVDTVLSGQSRNGVAIVRPPGHHAECGTPMGFCMFNTVAIAAKYAQKQHGIKRVLILDWDVHHGNGTQHMFYEDPSILYISLHRYDGGFFFPGSQDGDFTRVGKGAGLGYNVNIPWHYGGKGDNEYLAAFQQIVMPIAYEFAPDLVLVSAGFDAAIGDPLGGCLITPAGYGHMTHMLSGLAGGRVILVLEGGYNLVSISNCMSTCTSVLLGDSVPQWTYKEPQNVAVMTICDVLDTHKKFWKSLKFRVGIPKIEEEEEKKKSKKSKKKKPSASDTSVEDSLVNLTENLTVQDGARPAVKDECFLVADKQADVTYDSGISSVTDKTHLATDEISKVTDDGSKNTDDSSKNTDNSSKNTDDSSKNTDDSSKNADNSSKNTDDSSKNADNSSKNTDDSSKNADNSSKNTDNSSKNTDEISEVTGETRKDPDNSLHTDEAVQGACGGAEGGNLVSNTDLLTQLGMQGVQGMYAVQPLPWCKHLQQVAPLPEGGLNVDDPCDVCQNRGENWVCLLCYKVFCSRYVAGHMVSHGEEAGHPLVLSYADLSVWCYQCDNYVANQVLKPAISSAHKSKFGNEL